MSVAYDLLAEAKRHGVSFAPTLAGDLVARAPRPPPPALVARLKAHRAELLEALAKAATDEFDERAAIVAEGAGVPRDWAEGLARLDTASGPGDVPPARWRQLIDDAGQFLDEWAATAQALGWNAVDLFGCNVDRPFARIDQAGLLWLLDGRRLIKLTAETAILETRSGARQTYRRRPTQPGQVLAWELDQ